MKREKDINYISNVASVDSSKIKETVNTYRSREKEVHFTEANYNSAVSKDKENLIKNYDKKSNFNNSTVYSKKNNNNSSMIDSNSMEKKKQLSIYLVNSLSSKNYTNNMPIHRNTTNNINNNTENICNKFSNLYSNEEIHTINRKSSAYKLNCNITHISKLSKNFNKTPIINNDALCLSPVIIRKKIKKGLGSFSRTDKKINTYKNCSNIELNDSNNHELKKTTTNNLINLLNNYNVSNYNKNKQFSRISEDIKEEEARYSSRNNTNSNYNLNNKSNNYLSKAISLRPVYRKSSFGYNANVTEEYISSFDYKENDNNIETVDTKKLNKNATYNIHNSLSQSNSKIININDIKIDTLKTKNTFTNKDIINNIYNDNFNSSTKYVKYLDINASINNPMSTTHLDIKTKTHIISKKVFNYCSDENDIVLSGLNKSSRYYEPFKNKNSTSKIYLKSNHSKRNSDKYKRISINSDFDNNYTTKNVNNINIKNISKKDNYNNNNNNYDTNNLLNSESQDIVKTIDTDFSKDNSRIISKEAIIKQTEFEEIISDKQKLQRYRPEDFIEGREFYKLRYICKKLREIYNTGFKKVLDNNLRLKTDDRQVIQISRNFLIKIETAFFQFNLHKFMDSYNTLKEAEIIYNEEEFSEILILYFGFDKAILGEFLSKDKGMNKDLTMLLFFIHKLDFEGLEFLEAFRFLWQTITPPKDSNLILSIVNIFTCVYEKDNPEYYNSDDLFLLCSTIMALNTSLHKKIETVKPLSIDAFIKMNTNIEKEDLTEIYNELKENKLDFRDDYQENFLRLALEIKQINASNNSLQRVLSNKNLNFDKMNIDNKTKNNCSTSKENDFTSNTNTTKNNYNKMINMLKKGEYFTKYGKNGDPHNKFIYLSKDEQYIVWRATTCSYIFKKDGKIHVSKLKQCYYGIQQSEIFHKNNVRKDLEPNCFSIVAKDRTLDLRHENTEITKSWFKAVKEYIAKCQSQEKLRKKTFKNSYSIIVDSIWKDTILPEWGAYREYLFSKNLYVSFNNNKVSQFKRLLEISNKSAIETLINDKSYIIYIWSLGLPNSLRTILWKIVVGNKLNINEILFNDLIYLVHLENKQLNNRDSNKKLNFINNKLLYNSNTSSHIDKYDSDTYNLIDNKEEHNINKEIIEDLENIKDAFTDENNNMLDKDKINLIKFNSKVSKSLKEEQLNYNTKANYNQDNIVSNFNSNDYNYNQPELDNENNKHYKIESIGFENKANNIRKKNIFCAELIKNKHNSPIFSMIVNDINKICKEMEIDNSYIISYNTAKSESISFRDTNTKYNLYNKECNKFEEFKKEVLIVVLCFNKLRPDIPYSLDLAYIAVIVMLQSEDYYSGFTTFSNIIIDNYFSEFFKDNEKFVKSRFSFFESTFEHQVPSLYKQFQLFGYNTNLFFYDWIPSMFLKFFKVKTSLRLWDLFIIKKEVFVYEIAIGLLLFMEKDLRQSTFDETGSYLNKFNNRYIEDDFFELLGSINLFNNFNLMSSQLHVSYEKSMLYEALLEEED